MAKSTPTNNTSSPNNNIPRKPRRSIKAEGTCLSNLLRSGDAKVIDASKLGKRLSSEIWNSFGAIHVRDDFENSAIATKVVSDTRICQYFVACSRCFSVFKYDGHAYGTTGLVKHVKICNQSNRSASSSSIPTSFSNGPVTRKTTTTAKGRHVQPSLRYLARVIEELRGEQIELKQKINEMINMIGPGYIEPSTVQVISSNEGDKVDHALQNKND